MCIINLDELVERTNLLIAINGSQQLVVYKNSVANLSGDNAMVLPVPNPWSLKFYDLSKYTSLFKDLHNMCTQKMQMRGGCGSTLKVQIVGDYAFSVVHSLDELKNIDKNVFSLSAGCEQMLSREYGTEQFAHFGFIVCKMVGKKQSTPKPYSAFAYSHQINNENDMFVPTKHYHNSDEEIIPDWDHIVYLYNATLRDDCKVDKYNNWAWDGSNEIKQNFFEKCSDEEEREGFYFGELCHFERIEIETHDHFRNIDLHVVPDFTPNVFVHTVRNK